MTDDCTQQLRKLKHPVDRTLNDPDLASISRQTAQQRIDRYNRIKANEETLLGEFARECPTTRTNQELQDLRAKFRLARLLIVASFRQEGSVPQSLAGDFSDQAIETAVEFEQYKMFDTFDGEEEIARKIRRMDGEMYELVREYTETQLSDLDQLQESSDVQRDVMANLKDRYSDRLEKIRYGFFEYVEMRGLPNVLAAVEDALETVDESQAARESAINDLNDRLDNLERTVESGFRRQRQTVERQLDDVEAALAESNPDLTEIRRRLRSLDSPDEGYEQALSQLQQTVAETKTIKSDLETKVSELENAQASSADTDAAVADAVSSVVDEELSALRERHAAVAEEVDRLETERERLTAARERLDERQTGLLEQVEQLETDEQTAVGVDGTTAVTPTVARLHELDYVGAFEKSVHDTATIRLADETFSVPEEYWENRSERRNERPRLHEFLDDDQSAEQFPVNLTARFEVTDSGMFGFGGGTRLVVEATVLSDLEAHVSHGFDAGPATLEDLLTYVDRAAHQAEATDTDTLLGLASPTGWSEAVRTQVLDGDVSRTRFSRRLSVVLVDLRDGELVYDTTDPVADENAHLYALPDDDRRLADCLSFLREQLDGVGFEDGLILSDVTAETGYRAHIVKRAFDRLVEQEGCDLQYIDGELVLFTGG
jgi:predicted  nucleic acid-binding Zn-ribbon protein